MDFKTENGLAFTTADVKELLEWRSNNHLLNEYSRYFYRQYIHIRNCCNPKKCKSISIDTVRERTKQEPYKQLIQELLGFSDEQVHYIINFCQQHIKYL